jgi:hypothetical protein
MGWHQLVNNPGGISVMRLERFTEYGISFRIIKSDG